MMTAAEVIKEHELRLEIAWLSARYDEHFPPCIYARLEVARRELRLLLDNRTKQGGYNAKTEALVDV